MKFISTAIPKPALGASFEGVLDCTVPDQSMTLQEILDRFTRGEVLPIGKTVQYHESEDDLEKVSHLDLVDRAEFIESQKETRRKFEKQEKAKKERERLAVLKKIEEEERAKLAKQQSTT